MRGGRLEPGCAARHMARHTTDHTRLTTHDSEVQPATARRSSLVGAESPLRRVIKQCADTRGITGHGGGSSDSSDFTDSNGPTPPRLRTGCSSRTGSLRNVGADVTLMGLDQPSTLNLHRTHTLTCTLAPRP